MLVEDSYIPSQLDLGIVRGDDGNHRIVLRDKDSGDYIDVMQADVRAQIRTVGGKLIDTFTVGDGFILEVVVEDEVSMPSIFWVITKDRSSNYDLGQHVYDVEVTINDFKRTVISGKFNVLKDQTK